MRLRINLFAWASLLVPVCASAFESGRAAFAIQVNDLAIPYRVFAVYALPGELLDVAVGSSAAPGAYEAVATSGALQGAAPAWSWRAPDAPGLATLKIENAIDEIRLNVFIMHPAADVVNGRINGFRIGEYPSVPLNGNSLYLPPVGFIELNQDNADVELSPHFRLSQFPSKQAGGFPKYLVLREQLLLKLELLLENVNENGIAADSFTIMSGYRTPFYNAAIGNVANSRHVFGGAADIYVDVNPVDDQMDDLNGDGSLDFRDAQYLYRFADVLFSLEANQSLRGGLGVYRRNSAHGPFLHVDARARRARWGLLP